MLIGSEVYAVVTYFRKTNTMASLAKNVWLVDNRPRDIE